MHSLFLIVYICLFGRVFCDISFLQINSSAGWPPREYARVHRLRNPTTYINQNRSIHVPTGSFILYAGLCTPLPLAQCNDVWVSTDRGESWDFVPQTANSYTTYYSSALFSDPVTDQLYVMADGGYPRSNTISPLWSTRNLSHWDLTLPTVPVAPTWDRSQFSCIIDSQSYIYYLTSQNYSLQSTHNIQLLHEIWQSRDHGQSWSTVTISPAFPARINSIVGIHLRNWHLQNRDIMYLLGGGGPTSPLMNDIWVSSDGAVSWTLLIPQVPWQYSWISSSFHVTSEGVLLIATNYIYPTQRGTLWLSLDGGYNWGVCVMEPPYYTRQAPSVITDGEGYPYIIAGGTNDGKAHNDVWRGTISVHNWTAVAKACGLKVPAVGVGLTRWPGESPSSSSSTAGRSSSSTPGISASSGTSRSSSSSTAGSGSLSTPGISASSGISESSSSSTTPTSSSTAGPQTPLNDSSNTTLLVAVIGLAAALILIGTYLGYRYFRKRHRFSVDPGLDQSLIQI